MKGFPLDKKKIFIGILIVLLFYLVMDLNARLANLDRLTDQRDRSSTDVAYLESTVSALHTQLAHATSEVAVEEWARQQGRLTRPGDVMVVPLSPGEVTQPAVIVPTATMEPVENWEYWYELFFGD